MELRHLRYFIAVAEELNFHRAAVRLHKSQPPVSRQIRELEEELGVTLFERGGRRVSLTPAGEAFLATARSTLGSLDLGTREARRIQTGNSGTLRVGFPDDTQFGRLCDLLGEFQREYPDILLDSRLDLSPRLSRLVLRGALDVAIVEPPLPMEARNLTTAPLPPTRMVAVIAPEHRLAGRKSIRLAELSSESFAICVDTPATSFRLQIDKLFEEAGFRPHITHISNATIMYTRIAVKAGQVALASEHGIPPRSEDYICIPLESASARIPMELLWHEPSTNRVAENFIAFIRARWQQ